MEKIYKKGEPFKKETLNLVEKVKTVDSTIFVPMTKEILWFRESEAEVVLTYKNSIIKNYTTFNDFYGYLGSIKSAIGEALELEKIYKIDKKSGLIFKVIHKIIETPVLSDPNVEKSFSSRMTYLEIPNNWFIHDQKAIDLYLEQLKSKDDDIRFNSYNNLNPISLETKTVYEDKEVWNSITKQDFETIRKNIK